MDYIFHIPAFPLNVYIDDIYYLDGPPPYPRLKVPPMPSLHLMINFGPAFQIYARDQTTPFATCTESWWIGMWSKYWIVDWPGPVRFYGVHFKPAGMYPFLRLPLSELHNQVVPMDAIWGHLAAEFREQLYAAPTIQAGLTLLEQLLLARLTEAPYGLEVVQHAMAQITQQHGALSIQALSDQISISQNHLLTQFKRMVGITPKDVARISRFAHIVCSLDPTKSTDWGRIVHKSRFYDLSHLNKDFVELTGLNPTDYLRLRCRFQVENPNHPLSVGPMPID
jgi:AraC-like DNA-binding protein